MLKKSAAMISALAMAMTTMAASCRGSFPDVWVEGTYTPQAGCEVELQGKKSTVAYGNDGQYEAYANSDTRRKAREMFPRKVIDTDSLRFLITLGAACAVRTPSGEKGTPASLDQIFIDFLKTPSDTSITGTQVIETFVYKGLNDPVASLHINSPTATIKIMSFLFANGAVDAQAIKGRVELTQRHGVIEKIHFKILVGDPGRSR